VIRVDRSKLGRGAANAMDSRMEHARFRRALNRQTGACVNENKMGTHGPATHGVRCTLCHQKRQAAR
jgi:hypothetical protein